MRQSPSAYAYQQSSPLETLVRRASSRKVATDRPGGQQRPEDLNLSRSPSRSPSASPTPDSHHAPAQHDVQYIYEPSVYVEHHANDEDHFSYAGQEQVFDMAPRTVGSRRPPESPLLHTQFRSSTGTTLTQFDNAYGPDGTQYDSMPNGRGRSVYRDDESIYSEASYARNSVAPPHEGPLTHLRPHFGGHAQPDRDTVDDFSAFYRQSQFTAHEPPPLPQVSNHFSAAAVEPVPKVVVSEVLDTRSFAGSRDHLSAPATHLNFSRPRGSSQSGTTPTSSLERPVLPPRSSSESKRLVIERNLNRVPSSPRLTPGTSQTPGTPSSARSAGTYSSPSSPGTPYAQSAASGRSPSPSAGLSVNDSGRSRSSSVASSPSPSPNGSSADLSLSASSQGAPSASRGLDGRVLLAGRSPSPAGSGAEPSSPYSNYSFYQLESPGGARLPSTSAGAPSPAPPSFQVNGQPVANPGPPSAEDYLQKGIDSHQANRLEESASYFELSAKTDGGSGAGMLMWGLALRHGWGVAKDEKMAFKWLRRAAEGVTSDLEKGRGKGKERDALKKELILAIYEVGQCFFHGWGVAKDQKMAVNYFTTAARLGDPDAQQELAFCLLNGKGCKKDRKESAKWYRAAVAQGASDVGLAWIHKEKYR